MIRNDLSMGCHHLPHKYWSHPNHSSEMQIICQAPLGSSHRIWMHVELAEEGEAG